MSETDFAAFERYLERKGWIRRPDGTYSDGSLELVFDTSQYLEVYRSDGSRMVEGRIRSVAELEAFLNEHGLKP